MRVSSDTVIDGPLDMMERRRKTGLRGSSNANVRVGVGWEGEGGMEDTGPRTGEGGINLSKAHIQ